MKILNITILIFLLVGCLPKAPAPPVQPSKQQIKTAYSQHLVQLKALNKWHNSGKISFYDGKTGGSAHYNFSYDKPNFTMILSGPLGIYTENITGNDKYIVLTDHKNKTIQVDINDPNLKKYLGSDIPLSGFTNWLKGIPIINLPHSLRYNNNGTLQSLTQLNWHIKYLKYTNLNQYAVPRLIKLEKDNTQIKIALTHWN